MDCTWWARQRKHFFWRLSQTFDDCTASDGGSGCVPLFPVVRWTWSVLGSTTTAFPGDHHQRLLRDLPYVFGEPMTLISRPPIGLCCLSGIGLFVFALALRVFTKADKLEYCIELLWTKLMPATTLLLYFHHCPKPGSYPHCSSC